MQLQVARGETRDSHYQKFDMSLRDNRAFLASSCWLALVLSTRLASVIHLQPEGRSMGKVKVGQGHVVKSSSEEWGCLSIYKSQRYRYKPFILFNCQFQAYQPS